MFLSDMQIFCDKILRYTNGLNQQAFFANDVVLDAVLRNLELLGEASKQITAEVRQLNSEVPWRRISGLRDLLAHHSNQYPRPPNQVVQRKKPLIIAGSVKSTGLPPAREPWFWCRGSGHRCGGTTRHY